MDMGMGKCGVVPSLVMVKTEQRGCKEDAGSITINVNAALISAVVAVVIDCGLLRANLDVPTPTHTELSSRKTIFRCQQ